MGGVPHGKRDCHLDCWGHGTPPTVSFFLGGRAKVRRAEGSCGRQLRACWHYIVVDARANVRKRGVLPTSPCPAQLPQRADSGAIQ